LYGDGFDTLSQPFSPSQPVVQWNFASANTTQQTNVQLRDNLNNVSDSVSASTTYCVLGGVTRAGDLVVPGWMWELPAVCPIRTTTPTPTPAPVPADASKLRRQHHAAARQW